MADTKVSGLTAATAPLDGTELVPVVQGGTSKKATLLQIREQVPTVVLGSTVVNSTVTPAMGIEATGLGAGTYNVKCWVVYQAAATTTGIEMFLNFTGTATRVVSTWYTLTTGGAAATGVADQATTLTAQMMEGKGQRANNTASGPTQGVDTANADQFAVVEGVVVVTAAGSLQVMFRSEVAASAITLQVGTNLDIRKVA